VLDNKVSGQFDIFERKRSGLHASQYDVLLPSEVGYILPLANLNSDAHRGLEGAITYRGTAGELSYSLGINGTVSRRRDLEQYKPRFGNSWNEYRNSFTDRWANINWGYQVAGQFQSQDEIDNYAVDNDGQGNRTQLPGDLIFKDINGDKVINDLDQRPIGFAEGANPYFSYGINTSFAYKGFSLFVDFSGASMQSFLRDWELRYPFQNNGTSPAYMFEDRWHRADPFNNDSPWVPGTYPAIRKDNAGHANFRRSDYWVTNVRYIRLRNLELGYTVPQKLINKVSISNLRVYANASNLFSIDNTKEFGIDPEISSANGLVYPQQRLFNFGFVLGL
jgi:hypothetical protein